MKGFFTRPHSLWFVLKYRQFSLTKRNNIFPRIVEGLLTGWACAKNVLDSEIEVCFITPGYWLHVCEISSDCCFLQSSYSCSLSIVLPIFPHVTMPKECAYTHDSFNHNCCVIGLKKRKLMKLLPHQVALHYSLSPLWFPLKNGH